MGEPISRQELTSFLLLKGQLGPALLHAVPQGHPQLGLLLGRHGLPSLLDVGERRLGDGVSGAGAADGSRHGAADEGLAQQVGGRRAHHDEGLG